jgi:D-3-phosphoglycerate dehydrogenase
MSRKPIKILESNNCEIDWSGHGVGLLSDSQLACMIEGYDGLLVGDDEVREMTLERADRLKVIAKHGVGIDNIDVALATRNGIVVTRAVESNSESVADFVFTLILGLVRMLINAASSVKRGFWEPTKYIGIELRGKTLGIIGLGAIGERVAKRALGFNMDVVYYDVERKRKIERDYAIQFLELGDVLQKADVVTIHVPLTESTKNLIGCDELRTMKKTAYLVNTSRGEVVDEKALYKALKQDVIAGAAVDVYSQEPPEQGFPLIQLENVLATPHIASYTVDANINMGTIVAEEIVRVLKGEKPKHAVNVEALIQGSRLTT